MSITGPKVATAETLNIAVLVKSNSQNNEYWQIYLDKIEDN